MSGDSTFPTPAVHSSLEWDYEYDKDNDVFLFYPSRPPFEQSRDDSFPPHPIGFYNLPVFRGDRNNSPLPLRPPESVHSDNTAVEYVGEDFYGREGDVLRSVGYSRCLCLGLISVGARNSIKTPARQVRTPFSLCNFFAKLWDRFLHR